MFFPIQGQNFTLRQLAPGTSNSVWLAFCAESAPTEVTRSVCRVRLSIENEAVMSSEHAMRLWGRGSSQAAAPACQAGPTQRSPWQIRSMENNHRKPASSFLWLYNVGVRCFCVCFGWLWRNGLPSLFFLAFALQHSTQKMSFNIALFFPREKKVNVRHQSVKLCYASILCCVSYSFENSLIMYRKKKVGFLGFISIMSPVILHGVAENLVIKFTPEPACNQS